MSGEPVRWQVIVLLVGRGVRRRVPLRAGVGAVLLLLWLVAVIAASVRDDTAGCVGAASCSPDLADAWLGVDLATPVLLLWRPTLGAVSGVVFALGENLSESDTSGHLPFALHGAACLVGLLVLRSRGLGPWRERVPAVRRHSWFDDHARPSSFSFPAFVRAGISSGVVETALVGATALAAVGFVVASAQAGAAVTGWLIPLTFAGSSAVAVEWDRRVARRRSARARAWARPPLAGRPVR